MTVSTLRPNATNSISGSLGGGAGSAHAALSDDDDLTYVELDTGESVDLEFTDLVLPAGAVIKTPHRARVRTAKVAGFGAHQLFGVGGVTQTESGSVGITWTTPTDHVLVSFAFYTDAGGLRLDHLAGSGDIRIYEAYLDVVYVTQPVANPTVPPTGTITDDHTPLIAWGVTFDSDGGVPTHYEAKIFNDAQYGGGGFDPDTTPTFFDSGVVEESPVFGFGYIGTETFDLPLPDDTYKAYVRVAQTVNGELHWGEWAAGPAFTIDIDHPALVSVNVIPDDGAAGNLIDVETDPAGDVSADFVEFQASYDGGVNWHQVRTASGDGRVEVASDAASEFDHEAPNGVLATYRVRAVHDFGGTYSYSDWLEDTGTWESRSIWLKHPTNPDLNYEAAFGEVSSFPGQSRGARQGTHHPLGATYPVVVSDTETTEAGEIVIRIDSDDGKDAMDELLATGSILLLQFPATDHEGDRWIKVGDRNRQRVVDKSWIGSVNDSLSWVEVERPGGAIETPQTGEGIFL